MMLLVMLLIICFTAGRTCANSEECPFVRFPHAIYSTVSVTVGTILDYRCERGYMLQDRSARNIQSTCVKSDTAETILRTGGKLEWRPPLQQCLRIKCNTTRLKNWLTNINANMNVSGNEVTGGDNVRVVCYHGFALYLNGDTMELKESFIVRCNDEGLWQGVEELLLYREYKCLKKRCKDLEIEYAAISSLTQQHGFCQRIAVRCIECFQFESNTVYKDELEYIKRATCNIDGSWEWDDGSISTPTCQALQCDSLAEKLQNTSQLNDSSVSCGISVQAKCTSGLSFSNLEDVAIYRCNGTKWLPKPEPCRKRCEEIVVENADTYGSAGTEVNEKFMVHCLLGFMFPDKLTSKVAKCLEGQMWTKIPNCTDRLTEEDEDDSFKIIIILLIVAVTIVFCGVIFLCLRWLPNKKKREITTSVSYFRIISTKDQDTEGSKIEDDLGKQDEEIESDIYVDDAKVPVTRRESQDAADSTKRNTMKQEKRTYFNLPIGRSVSPFSDYKDLIDGTSQIFSGTSDPVKETMGSVTSTEIENEKTLSHSSKDQTDVGNQLLSHSKNRKNVREDYLHGLTDAEPDYFDPERYLADLENVDSCDDNRLPVPTFYTNIPEILEEELDMVKLDKADSEQKLVEEAEALTNTINKEVNKNIVLQKKNREIAKGSTNHESSDTYNNEDEKEKEQQQQEEKEQKGEVEEEKEDEEKEEKKEKEEEKKEEEQGEQQEEEQEENEKDEELHLPPIDRDEEYEFNTEEDYLKEIEETVRESPDEMNDLSNTLTAENRNATKAYI